MCFIQQKYLQIVKGSHSTNLSKYKGAKSITVHSRQAIKKGLTHVKGTCTHRSHKSKRGIKNPVEIRSTQYDGYPNLFTVAIFNTELQD
jgi:hypothetical protein